MSHNSLEPRRLLCPNDGRLLRADTSSPQVVATCPGCPGIWVSGDSEPRKTIDAILDLLGWLFIDLPEEVRGRLSDPDPHSYVPPRTERGPEPRIVTYRNEYRSYFDSLNRRWIEQHFRMEPRDEAVLGDPEGEILAGGGEIFFLVPEDGTPVGTCAMIRTGDGVYYLAKMAVAPKAQGRGYGERLLVAALDWARSRRARRVDLTSNTVLAPAIALYRKHGFQEVPLEPSDAEYERVNIRMALDFAEP